MACILKNGIMKSHHITMDQKICGKVHTKLFRNITRKYKMGLNNDFCSLRIRNIPSLSIVIRIKSIAEISI